MKPNTFSVAMIAFVATTATIETTLASLTPTMTNIAVWVRRVEWAPPTAPSNLNVFAGIHYLTTTTIGVDVTVLVDDFTTPSTNDTRKGRYTQLTNDAVIKTSSPITIIPTPLPIVP